jgi:hypothetical protein
MPEDIAVDGKGIIYVTDTRNPEFKYLKQITDFKLRKINDLLAFFIADFIG